MSSCTEYAFSLYAYSVSTKSPAFELQHALHWHPMCQVPCFRARDTIREVFISPVEDANFDLGRYVDKHPGGYPIDSAQI